MATKKLGSTPLTATILVTSVDLSGSEVTSVLPTDKGGTHTGTCSDGQVLVGQTDSGQWSKKTMSGDATMNKDGVLTVGNDKITYAKMQNVSATDRFLCRVSSGAGDVEEAVCTAAARGLLDDATTADMRTTLGLVIGTNVQAQSEKLSDIANLSDPNADRILFWDDSDGHVGWLMVGSNLSISGTTINASAGSDPILEHSSASTTNSYATVFDQYDSRGMHGVFTIMNAGGSNHMDIRILVTDAFGGDDTLTTTLAPGQALPVSFADLLPSPAFGTAYPPYLDISLEVKSNTPGSHTTYDFYVTRLGT